MSTNVIQIKRSATTATPPSLADGELAYSGNSGNLFIGQPGNVVTKIGGASDVTRLANTSGTMTGVASNVTGVVAIANGGTGKTTAVEGRVALGATGKAAASIGNGAATTINFTHGLNTTDITVSVFESASPYAQIFCDVSIVDANTISCQFGVAPNTNQYRVVVVG